jgi:hypothetical protein
MVHAWDHLRFKVDFVGEKDLRQAACTEVSYSWFGWAGWPACRLAGWVSVLIVVTDPRVYAQRRVQVVERGDHERELDAFTTVPGLREMEGGSVRHGAPAV